MLTAVALQDHLVKSLSLQDPVKKQINHRSPTSGNNIQKTISNCKKKQTSKTSGSEREYVLGPKPKPLTLGRPALSQNCCIYFACYSKVETLSEKNAIMAVQLAPTKPSFCLSSSVERIRKCMDNDVI